MAVNGSEDPALTLRVEYSWFDVIVVPDRFTEGLWSILAIKEMDKHGLEGPVASAVSATEGTTWGGIKSMWAKR
jgi:hypothetical protein